MQQQVDIAHITDYHKYIDPEDEMWLQHIAHKARLKAYSSVAEFQADIQRIEKNCRAYNTPGCGHLGTQSKLTC